MDRLELLKAGTGQTITFKPQQGRASATPTVAIVDDTGTTLTAASAANVTLDVVNTTVSTANSAGDISIELTSVANINVRQSYILTSTLGKVEEVRVAAVDSVNSLVYFDEPLEHVYAATSMFEGFWFVYAVQTADVAALDDGKRARALYTAGGVQCNLDIGFDVCLTPLPNVLTVEFVKQHRPDVMAQEHSETLGSDLEDLRDAAMNAVRRAIRSHDTGWRPALLKTPEDVVAWALLELDKLCQRNGINVVRGVDGIEALEYIDNELSSTRRQCLASLQFMDLSDDDSKSADEVKPLRMNLVR